MVLKHTFKNIRRKNNIFRLFLPSATYLVLFHFILQLIQTISAVDTDEPLVGHKFVFSMRGTNPNFTIVDKEGKSLFTPQHEVKLL